MKRKSTICVLSVFFSLFCIPLNINAQEVSYEGEKNGLIMLSVSEFNVKKQDAISRAIIDAYNQILFRGIPGSKEYQKALWGSEEMISVHQRQYYDNMVNNNRIYSFVNYSRISYYKRKEAIVNLTINIKSLVEDLERNNLYKRLGLY